MRAFVCLIATILVGALAGCGGGGSSSQPISVRVLPPFASVALNGTQQIGAAVANTTNQGVTWSVLEGAVGGTVSASGLYTAPLNSSGVFHVEVLSKADPKQGAISTVTVHLSISASPTTASLTVSQTQAFTAHIIGTNNTAVTWSVMESNGGSISSAGIYQAPANATGTFHIVATSAADSTQTAQCAVTVVAGSGSITIQ